MLKEKQQMKKKIPISPSLQSVCLPHHLHHRLVLQIKFQKCTCSFVPTLRKKKKDIKAIGKKFSNLHVIN